MAQKWVKLEIPFEALLEAVTKLKVGEKRRIWQALEVQLAQAEEEEWERDPAHQAELREARNAYEAGDFITLDEFIDRPKD